MVDEARVVARAPGDAHRRVAAQNQILDLDTVRFDDGDTDVWLGPHEIGDAWRHHRLDRVRRRRDGDPDGGLHAGGTGGGFQPGDAFESRRGQRQKIVRVGGRSHAAARRLEQGQPQPVLQFRDAA